MAKTGIGALYTLQPAEILINGDRAIATTTINICARIPYKGCELDLTAWAHQLSTIREGGRRLEDSPIPGSIHPG
jgi:hypothetical protein